jgi:hypothetical protein
MARKQLSKKTQNKVRKYLEYLIETENENKLLEENVLSTFSEGLRDEILKEINGKVLREQKLFQNNFGTNFLSQLYNYLEEKTFAPSEVIFNVNDIFLSFNLFSKTIWSFLFILFPEDESNYIMKDAIES